MLAWLLLLEHVLQWTWQVLEHRVEDALLVLIFIVPTACWDGFLGAGQAPLTWLLQGCLLLSFLLLFLLQAILEGREIGYVKDRQ